MVELISYSVSDFLQRKGVTPPIDENMKKKYDALLASADCFFSNGFINKAYVKPVAPNAIRAPQVRNKTFVKPNKGLIGSYDKHYIKKAKSILNVINSSNYDKQLNKMNFIMDSENANEIVPLILSVGVMQIFYVTLFVKLLVDISKEYKARVIQHVDDFITKLLESKFGISITQNNENNYDSFCDMQKQKQAIISSGVFALHLIQRGLTKYNTDHYMDILLEICNEKKDDETLIDIILHILLESKKIVGKNIDVSKFKSLFEECAQSNKLRFMVETLF